ncbi:hypothetical protein P389DRAFT_197181 [Cystobasidium minutum MCA 4210]|uniref:uncharacterized protein n=1 Tax=Cystobasidium minutum MCA 4210 TaxID=1397322 RepID=UPI0034CF9A93|eukprot:jgi/Rhomi1/197181/gm1.5395_g
MSLDWANVKYCSKTCRSKKPHSNRIDQGIELSFLSLLLHPQLPGSSNGSTEKHKKVTCEQVQDYDGGERSTTSSTGINWRERYRRAARRLANVQMLCDIEHSEKGDNHPFIPGDGKGTMRIWLKDGKWAEASERFAELEDGLLKYVQGLS